MENASLSALFVCHHIQRANPEKNGYNAQVVKCVVTKSAKKEILVMFVIIRIPNGDG